MRTFDGIARQLGELEARLEALLHREALVVGGLLQRRAALGELRDHLAALVVRLIALVLAIVLCPYCRNGKLNALSKARASSSVLAVVQTMTSMPQIWSTSS